MRQNDVGKMRQDGKNDVRRSDKMMECFNAIMAIFERNQWQGNGSNEGGVGSMKMCTQVVVECARD